MTHGPFFLHTTVSLLLPIILLFVLFVIFIFLISKTVFCRPFLTRFLTCLQKLSREISILNSLDNYGPLQGTSFYCLSLLQYLIFLLLSSNILLACYFSFCIQHFLSIALDSILYTWTLILDTVTNHFQTSWLYPTLRKSVLKISYSQDIWIHI